MTTTHMLEHAEAEIAYDVHGPLPTADGRPPRVGGALIALGIDQGWDTVTAPALVAGPRRRHECRLVLRMGARDDIRRVFGNPTRALDAGRPEAFARKLREVLDGGN